MRRYQAHQCGAGLGENPSEDYIGCGRGMWEIESRKFTHVQTGMIETARFFLAAAVGEGILT